MLKNQRIGMDDIDINDMTGTFHLAVIGSRTFTDRDLAFAWLDRINSELGPFDMVVSGGARGADALGELWSKYRGIKPKIFKADWSKYGKQAGYIRNSSIIDAADIVVAFWDGISNGTKHSIELSKKSNTPILVIDMNGDINTEYSTIHLST